MTAQDPHNNDYLSPRSRYYGSFSPEKLAFNANLQEFALRVNTVCSLETGGKITPDDAYYEIKKLWQQLATSYAALGIHPDDD
jgi:isopropylmalate/homocitrate/citramalate synthase